MGKFIVFVDRFDNIQRDFGILENVSENFWLLTKYSVPHQDCVTTPTHA